MYYAFRFEFGNASVLAVFTLEDADEKGLKHINFTGDKKDSFPLITPSLSVLNFKVFRLDPPRVPDRGKKYCDNIYLVARFESGNRGMI